MRAGDYFLRRLKDQAKLAHTVDHAGSGWYRMWFTMKVHHEWQGLVLLLEGHTVSREALEEYTTEFEIIVSNN